MSAFPKPEKGVPRYELWIYSACFREWRRFASWTRSTKPMSDRWNYAAQVCGAEAPAYIYDRKTGEVIATNEEELSR